VVWCQYQRGKALQRRSWSAQFSPKGVIVLDFICSSCGTFSFDDSTCSSCDGSGDDVARGDFLQP
jgi:hypothetical protein